jgi:intein/homing endonuclease
MENTPLWCFEHHWNSSVPEKNIISLLENNTHLQELYDNKELWKGCFGAMTFISYEFLKEINAKYNLYNIINYMQSRFDRTHFERILSVLITYEKYEKQSPLTTSIFGNIHDYCKWEYTYTDYISDKMNNNINLPIIKIWSGR